MMKKGMLPLLAVIVLALPIVSVRGENSPPVDQLIKDLGGYYTDPSLKAASDALYKIGRPAVPALIEALNNPNPGIRKGAAQILGDLKVKEAIVPISGLLTDGEYWVARSAVYALTNIADPAVIPYLIEALKRPNPKVKEAALYGLDEMQAKSAAPEVAHAMLNDSDQYVRWRAMKVLSGLEKGAEIKAMTAALENPKSGIRARRNAAQFLGTLQVKSAGPLLVKTFNDKDAGTRWRAIEAIGKVKDLSARAAVEDKLSDPDLTVRMFAISTLAMLGDRASVPALAKMLTSKTPEIRKNTIRALEKLGGKAAAAAVRGELSDRSKYIRAMAAEVLGGLKDKDSVPGLLRLLSDRSAVVQVAALYALGEVGGAEEVTAVKGKLNNKNFWVKEEARKALAKLEKKK